MPALQGGGSAPAVGTQPGVGGQMLVAMANPIQVEPHDKPHDMDMDTDNVLAILPGDDDDARYCYCSLTKMKQHQNDSEIATSNSKMSQLSQ